MNIVRILKICITVITVIAVIFALCFYLFREMGFVLSILVCFGIFSSWSCISAFKHQIYIKKLHKKGCRTDGTLTYVVYVRNSYNCISYQADGKEYTLKSGLKMNKWKKGYNKIPVIYDPECPENACLEKYALVSAIGYTVMFSILEAIWICSTIYAIIISLQ